MTAAPELDLVTVAEAARLLRVSPVTIHRWIKRGLLPSCHVGPRAVRIRRSDLENMIRPDERDSERAAAEGERYTPQRTTPYTEEEKQRISELIERARIRGERILASRGGEPLEEAWIIINEARDDPSRHF